MNGVFELPPAEEKCRVCGSTHAPNEADGAPEKVCDYCWKAFRQSLKDGEAATESIFNRWLARQLYLSVRRLHIYGVMGRCEAITQGNEWLHNRGQQCRGNAVAFRNGHRVCAAHNRAENPVWAGLQNQDPYTTLSDLMADLARIDPSFVRCLFRAIEIASQPAQPAEAAE